MARQVLHESFTTLLERKGARWRAVLITPGQGSSGFYAESMLEANLHAFEGNVVKNYFKHPEKPGAQRDPRDQWGYVEEGTVRYEPGVGVVGEINVLDHWKPVIESLAKAGQASLSVYISAERDSDGNVTALYPHVKNSVDLVDYPGRPGSALTEQMLESALAGFNEPAVEASAEEKEDPMTPEELKAALAEALAPVIAFVTKEKDSADEQVQAEADAKAVDKAVEERLAAIAEKEAAIAAAEDLSPKQIESLKAAAHKGEDITQLLEDAKAIAADFKTLSESHDVEGYGRVVESAGNSNDDFTVAGFGGSF